MEYLSTEQLLEVLNKAIVYNLKNDFILLISLELDKRLKKDILLSGKMVQAF